LKSFYIVFKLSYAIIIIKHSNKINYYIEQKLLVNAISRLRVANIAEVLVSVLCPVLRQKWHHSLTTLQCFIVLLVHVSNDKILGYICLVIVTRRDSLRLRKHTVDRIDTIYLPRIRRAKWQITTYRYDYPEMIVGIHFHRIEVEKLSLSKSLFNLLLNPLLFNLSFTLKSYKVSMLINISDNYVQY